jgi:hypothetical protein
MVPEVERRESARPVTDRSTSQRLDRSGDITTPDGMENISRYRKR